MITMTANKDKPNCSKGHKYDDKNTYINPKNGWRGCRSCGRSKSKRANVTKHGISIERFMKIMDDQDYSCAICGVYLASDDAPKRCIDHDHAHCASSFSCGECVRGILCTKCNRGLGLFGDDTIPCIETLMRALTYLIKHKERADYYG
jgi:hypothetical protein